MLRIILFSSFAILTTYAGIAFGKHEQSHDATKEFFWGMDLFSAGKLVQVYKEVDDAFLAGEEISVGAKSNGSIHAAGREIRLLQTVGDNVYAAGKRVTISAPVVGSVNVAAKRLMIDPSAIISKDLRVAASEVILSAPVAGKVLIVAKSVELNNSVSGDAIIAAQHIAFGPRARISGKLTYYTSAPIDIPAHVIAAENVTFEKMDHWEKFAVPGLLFVLALIFIPWINLLIFGFLMLVFFKAHCARVLEQGLKRPVYTALVGLGAFFAYGIAVILFAFSVIGLPLAVALMLSTPLLLIFGYIHGANVLSNLFCQQIRYQSPVGLLGKCALLFGGVTLLYLLGAAPVVGPIIGFVVTLLGIGATLLSVRR